MNAAELIEYIRTAEKKTPVKVYIWERFPTSFPNAKVFPAVDGAKIVFGDWRDIGPAVRGRATVGARCHIGAGAVLAGVIEPASATPVVVEDDVLIGANAVVIEGCRIGRGAVVAAGAVVISDVPPDTVVAGCPARIIKRKDETSAAKTALVDALREL